MSRDPDDKTPLDPHDDVMRAIYLLEWARRKGVRIGPVLQIGDVKMQVNDFKQVRMEDLGGGRGQEPSVYQEHGLKEEDEPAPGTAG